MFAVSVQSHSFRLLRRISASRCPPHANESKDQIAPLASSSVSDDSLELEPVIGSSLLGPQGEAQGVTFDRPRHIMQYARQECCRDVLINGGWDLTFFRLPFSLKPSPLKQRQFLME